MKFYTLVNIALINFIINEDIWIWPNIFYKRELFDNETIFFLEIYDPKDDEKMKIELFLSHPSSYQISFNYSDYKEKEKEYEEETGKEEKEEEETEKGEEIEKEEEIGKEEEIEKEEETGKEKKEEEESEKGEEEEKEEKEEKEEEKEEEEEKEKEEEKNEEKEEEKEEELTETEKTNDEEENKIDNIIKELYKDNIFENSLRKLYEYPNDLIELEQEYSNKKTFILNLNKNMTIIQLILKKIKDTPEYIIPEIYIKYQYRKKEFKNYIFSNNLTTDLINGYLSVSFKGIIPEEENITEEFQVEYEAFLYKKKEEENYENINHVFLPNRYVSRSGTRKINNPSDRIYNLILTGIDQNGNDQWLEVVAEILYGYDREYFVYNITLVYIKNRTIVIPDDNTDNKTDNKTDDKTNGDDNSNDNNNILFYIIISAFAAIIIIIFMIIFIILRKQAKKSESFIIDKDENTDLLNGGKVIN